MDKIKTIKFNGIGFDALPYMDQQHKHKEKQNMWNKTANGNESNAEQKQSDEIYIRTHVHMMWMIPVIGGVHSVASIPIFLFFGSFSIDSNNIISWEFHRSKRIIMFSLILICNMGQYTMCVMLQAFELNIDVPRRWFAQAP